MSFDPFGRRLQLFTGKGGVGKTTVVAAVALEAARRGLRPLVVEMGHRASMQTVFGTSTIGHEPVALSGGVAAMNLDVDEAISEYVRLHVRLPRLASMVLGNAVLHRFFLAAPGIPELASLSKLGALLDEREADEPRWHPIVVDLDATGHALMLLELPRVLDGLVGRGPLRRVLSKLDALLADRSVTCLHLVTLPQDLPAQETLELYRSLSSGHRVPLGGLVVNRMPDAPLGNEPEIAVDDLAAFAGARGDTEWLDRARLAQRLVADRARSLSILDMLGSEVDLPVVTLPDLGASRGPDAPRLLAEAVAARLGRVT